MKKITVFLLAVAATTALGRDANVANNWHQWRGPEANGVSRTANPPLSWSEQENVKWKVPVEGKGARRLSSGKTKSSFCRRSTQDKSIQTKWRQKTKPTRILSGSSIRIRYTSSLCCVSIEKQGGRYGGRLQPNRCPLKDIIMTTTSHRHHQQPTANGSMLGSAQPACIATI